MVLTVNESAPGLGSWGVYEGGRWSVHGGSWEKDHSRLVRVWGGLKLAGGGELVWHLPQTQSGHWSFLPGSQPRRQRLRECQGRIASEGQNSSLSKLHFPILS